MVKIILSLTLLILAGLAFYSYQSGYFHSSGGEQNAMASEAKKAAAKVSQESALEHALKHADPTYVCPMHSQIVRGEPGSCPICGMDLVEVEVEEKEKEILYWVAPMDPNYRRDAPGKSPMGMDLVPVYKDEGDGVSVTIAPEVVQNLGVRTAMVERDKLWRKIDTVGYVNYDENRVSHVHQRTDGWIEKLYVKAVGDTVKRGQLLYELYSPEVVNAQQDYLQVLRQKNLVLRQSAETRLKTLGMPTSQIKRIYKTRKIEQTVKTYAQQDGFIAMLNVREGMYIKPETEVITLVDLSSVWVQVEVYESQADWVAAEQYADMTLSYLPGKTWEGKVDFVYPELDPMTRTLRARVIFDNSDGQLKPNMYANVTLYAGAKQDILVVPLEAIIKSGNEERVIIAQGDGKFASRKVVIGLESGDFVEVLSGLDVGEEVVTSGQFLIDSEASLKASLLRMQSSK